MKNVILFYFIIYDSPNGLPLKHKMTYNIPLELDKKPPFKMIYGMNPLELQEAKTQIKEYLGKRMKWTQFIVLWVSHNICEE